MSYPIARPPRSCSTAALLLLASPLLLGIQVHAQTTVAWFTGGAAFAPPFVNREEATLGVVQHVGSSRLDVAVGNAFDAVRWISPDRVIAWGPDLFVFALSRNLSGFRLKIAAADGYFGMHFSLTERDGWEWRFRALHYSAHLVDGLYDSGTRTWMSDREPFPFSRNFGELTAARRWSADRIGGRAWVSIAGSIFTKPREIRPWSGAGGVEAFLPGHPTVYAAYQCGLLGVPTYSATHAAQAGVKFGEWSGSGLRLFLHYHAGLEPFGEFYSSRLEYAGIGFAFDYW